MQCFIYSVSEHLSLLLSSCSFSLELSLKLFCFHVEIVSFLQMGEREERNEMWKRCSVGATVAGGCSRRCCRSNELACSCQLLLKSAACSATGWNWYLTFSIRRFFYCDDDTKLLSRQNPHSNCHNPLDFRLTRFIFSCAWCKQVKASWTHEEERWEMKIGRISEMFSITDDISATPRGGGAETWGLPRSTKILIQTQTHKVWVTREVLKMWELLKITLRRSKTSAFV